MAELVTLSGDYGHTYNSRVGRRNQVSQRNEELMAGLLDYLKSAGSFVISPVVGLAKGVTHAGMEVYRGVKTGDIKRVLSAPFKGVTHSGMEVYRDIKEHSEYYYRPSKMKDWMKPIGGAIMAIGAIPGPHSIFMIPIGAFLTLSGSLGESIYINDQIKKAQVAQSLVDAQEQRKTNYIWYGVAAIGLVGSWMVFT